MKADIEDAGILDAHLDSILRIAFMYEDLLRTNEAEERSHRDYKESEKAIFQETLSLSREKYLEACRQHDREAHKRVFQKKLSIVMRFAAAVLLIVVLMAPIAIAKVEFLRVRVMKLLISIQDDHTDIALQEDEEASFNVPAEWRGDYYPSYITDGYSIKNLSSGFITVEFENPEGKCITFGEYTETAESSVDSENAEVKYISINGNMALAIHKYDNWMLIWSNGERYFIVDAEEFAEAVKIAEGVRRINR